jgi:choline dehydrogenase-like flavoprotein
MGADVLVVGSGASGVNAAFPLVEAGHRVTLVDFGNTDRTYAPLVPHQPFTEVRQKDAQQHRYFLGDHFEGVPFGKIRVGAQLTPPRLHISADTAKWMPLDSNTFSPTESLAVGGLAAGWGAGAFPFDAHELEGLPFTHADLEPHYETVAERVGVSGARDDLLPFLGDSKAMQPPLDIDSNAEAVLTRYQRRREKLNADGFFMGKARLAVCSQPHRGRGGHAYRDMEFWADTDRSVYRPQWTLEELKRFPNFRYVDRRFVLAFSERADGGVSLQARHADTGATEQHDAHALVLAAGTLSTARIVLRSLGRYGERVPLVCNPYTYVPMVNLGMLGQAPRDRRHSLTQLEVVYHPKDGVGMHGQLYSYRSLLMFKLLKEAPLPLREGVQVMQLLMPLVNILGIHHEDAPGPGKSVALHRADEGGQDRLEVRYEPTAEEERAQSDGERALLRHFLKLGCVPLKRIRPGHGSSIHYAGTFPMREGGGPLTVDGDCRLHGTRNVYLADGSVFPKLPSKGLTFTMMANADRVGTRLARRLAGRAQ